MNPQFLDIMPRNHVALMNCKWLNILLCESIFSPEWLYSTKLVFGNIAGYIFSKHYHISNLCVCVWNKVQKELSWATYSLFFLLQHSKLIKSKNEKDICKLIQKWYLIDRIDEDSIYFFIISTEYQGKYQNYMKWEKSKSLCMIDENPYYIN